MLLPPQRLEVECINKIYKTGVRVIHHDQKKRMLRERNDCYLLVGSMMLKGIGKLHVLAKVGGIFPCNVQMLGCVPGMERRENTVYLFLQRKHQTSDLCSI